TGSAPSGAVPVSASLRPARGLAYLRSPTPPGSRALIGSSTFISIIAAIVPATFEKTLAVAMGEDVGERAHG
ncbi:MULTISPECIES: hypothetical protein, partial [unclassified Methylobacterium]|uniref:hypothetical protein n=1 Tax=unclassified Methylobacterium TaxID=2615210 RepID=UPI00226A9967